MEKLRTAAQRLRDAAQALFDEPAPQRRNATIVRISEAIVDTNRAMLSEITRPLEAYAAQ